VASRPSTTLRISVATHEKLKKLAAQEGSTLTALLDRIVEQFRRKCIADTANAGYAAMRADSEVWAEEQRERAVWDVTLLDGLPQTVSPLDLNPKE